MKKKIIICAAVLLAAAVTALSVAAVTGNLSIFVSEDGTAERTEIAQNYNVKLMSDENIQVTYDKSRSIKEGFADIYKDEKSNEYIYKNGKLNGYYSNEIKHPMPDVPPIGKEAAIEIAKEWLPEFTENAKEYDLKSFEEKESYGQYYITFARKVGDIFTDECSEISVMYDGSVKYVSVQYDGKYDGVSEDVAKGITEEGLESYARSQMDIIYPNAEGEFVMNDHSLEKDENGYYIAIYGELDNRLERVRYYLEN